MIAEHGGIAAPAPGFVAGAGGARWSYDGPLTFAEAGPVLTAAHALALPREGEIDLSRLGAFDSAAVAVLVALAQRADQRLDRIADAPALPRELVRIE